MRVVRVVMGLILTRTHCSAQHLHAIDRTQPSLFPGVGHDDAWHLSEPLLGELLQWSMMPFRSPPGTKEEWTYKRTSLRPRKCFP
jgi:hypothetical protein